MIKKLRIRFVLISVLSVTFVLLLILSAINIANFINVKSRADSVLEILKENGGMFERAQVPPPEKNGAPDEFEDRGNQRFLKPQLDFATEETPFETRYFYVKYQDDNVVEVNTDNIVRVNFEEAVKKANTVRGKSKSGYSGEYRYLAEDDIVIFVDCTKGLQDSQRFLIYSLIFSVIGLFFVFLVSLFLSKKVLKPIILSYEKQKSFVSDAGHELKTPLTIISANNELQEMLGGENEYTEAIKKQIDRMNASIKNLITLAKINEKDDEIVKEKISISEIAKDMEEMFSSSFSRAGKELKSDISENVYIQGNEALIRQLFSVIIENALKYSTTYAKLNICSQGKKAIVEISNDTDNIEKGNLDKYFDRFYRSTEARASDIEGSGIGLSIAKEIVNLHSGEISASGTQSKIFILRIVF